LPEWPVSRWARVSSERSALLGHLSDRLKQRKRLYGLGAAVATLGWFVIVTVPGLPLPVFGSLLALIGFASAVIMIGYAYAKESAPLALAGTTGGVVNMGNMVCAMLMQPAVGWVLDRTWDGSIENGMRVYSFAAFRTGFASMLAWLVAAVLVTAFTRETHCRQRL
jgi:MFS family permease